ncbi:HAMP domain-containing protein [Pseudoduganella sp. FT93W]|uniref:HAMP domain-containing protein n=1 Tax=Duganella fentianensis TaxID=2692177 RepID=A0A845I293_9BURK|nr:methyl-accepting chemotaxis protein [Duganella fentianensis]MYN47650.1 HAMP domain-containing protein [Duganella fentianensis]
MTFAKKLYVLLAAAVMGMCAVGLISYLQISTVFEAANYANVNTLPSVEQLDNVDEAFGRMRIDTWKHLATSDQSERDQIASDMANAEAKIRDALTRYEKEDISDEQDRVLLSGVRQTIADYYLARDKVLKLSASGDVEQARKAQLSNQEIIARADRAISDHRAYNFKLADEGSKRAESVHARSTWISIAITVLFAVGIAIAGHFLIDRLSNALKSAVKIADEVAAGDLTREDISSGSDEVGQLLAALNLMSSKLNTIIGEVQEGATAIQTASHEIASGNMDLSARTEQQAGALEETAASIEELTSTVQNNAESTTQARQLANEAAETAIQGGEVVAQVIETMAAINASSVRIVDIISVIDGIAFQTNILALNAAVEAARAGEQGRGFAVVATEVRNLAQRSASAAKEIKMLIDDSVAQVSQGDELVHKAGAAMERLVEGVNNVARIIGEIADAGIQQSSGLHQVNQAVGEMDSFTQQNAALVEQSAAAATAMSEQAQNLNQLIGQFTLRAGTNHATMTKHLPRKAANAALGYTPST